MYKYGDEMKKLCFIILLIFLLSLIAPVVLAGPEDPTWDKIKHAAWTIWDKTKTFVTAVFTNDSRFGIAIIIFLVLMVGVRQYKGAVDETTHKFNATGKSLVFVAALISILSVINMEKGRFENWLWVLERIPEFALLIAAYIFIVHNPVTEHQASWFFRMLLFVPIALLITGWLF